MLQHTSRILVDDFLAKKNAALGMQSEANASQKTENQQLVYLS
jgi:hypothetical protein